MGKHWISPDSEGYKHMMENDASRRHGTLNQFFGGRDYGPTGNHQEEKYLLLKLNHGFS